MNPQFESYSFRGRNRKTKIIKCMTVFVSMLILVLMTNMEYISYLCVKSECRYIKAVLIEYQHSGRGVGGRYLLEYQNTKGEKKNALVKECIGDGVGKTVHIAVFEKAEQIFRIYPSVKGLLGLLIAVILCLHQYLVQFGKRPQKENSVDAIVVEKRRELYDGEPREYIIANYIDEQGKKYSFQSEKLPYQLNLSKGDLVEVSVCPDDYSKYFVQLEDTAISRKKVCLYE